MTIGERIRQARIMRSLSQRELGARLIKSPETIGNWERGKTSPPVDEAEQLADALGVGRVWLLTGDGKQPEWEVDHGTATAE